MGFPSGSVVKNMPVNAGDAGTIPGWRITLGEGNDNPLQYSCLENPMDRGAWQATVHRVSKSQTQQLLSIRMDVLDAWQSWATEPSLSDILTPIMA